MATAGMDRERAGAQPCGAGRVWQPIRPKRWGSSSKVTEANALNRPGYGERKLARERAKIPLFADLPGMLATADEYERIRIEENIRWGREMRRARADGWRRLRRWLDSADDADRVLWYRAWRCVPHDPCYGLDIATHIERYRGRQEGPVAWQFERHEDAA